MEDALDSIVQETSKPLSIGVDALDSIVSDLDELSDPFVNQDEEEDEATAIPLNDAPPFRIPRGKYKGITLPRMIGIKPSQWEKVNALCNEIKSDPDFQQHASSIVRTYAELRREAEAAAAVLSEVKLRLSAIMLMMIDQMEAEGESAVALKNGDKISYHTEPHLIVTDKEAFRQWCLSNELEREMVLPWGKANKLVKAMLFDGRPEPPGAVAYARPKVRFSKGEK